MQQALERGFSLFAFSGYSFLLSESQKSHAETRETGDKKGQSLEGRSWVRHNQSCFSWHNRNWGGGEKKGAEGCWPVKLGQIIGLGVRSIIWGHIIGLSVAALHPLLWQGRQVWMWRCWELQWQWIDSCLDWNICGCVLVLSCFLVI